MQFSHASMSSTSSCRRQRDSSELDVFDASRYLSGCIDGVGFGGFGYNSATMPSHRPNINPMKKSLEMMASIPCQKVESTVKEEKRCKQPISPGRKFATFLNSLFQQTPSKKKQKQKSVKQQEDQSNRERTVNSEHKGKKIARSLKSFNSIAFGEKKWLLRRNGDDFLVKRREEDGMREKKKKKIDEENFDHESDSSSDLFELKSYAFSDFSCRTLPVYQTAKAGFIRRGGSIFASFAF